MKNHKKIKHGLRYHRLYKTWSGMIQRCHQENNSNYKNYGLKGIRVCSEWHNIENFINDMYPTFIEGLSLDRIDSLKDYSKDNCRWATKTTQSRNRVATQSNSKVKLKGVSLNKSGSFIAQIKVNSKKIYIGSFKTDIEAAKAYDNYIICNNLEHTKNF